MWDQFPCLNYCNSIQAAEIGNKEALLLQLNHTEICRIFGIEESNFRQEVTETYLKKKKRL